MDDHQMGATHAPPAPASPDRLWLELSGGLLRGLGHALSNRIGAVRAVAQVLATAGEPSPLETALIAETERLQRTADLLRLLPRRAAEPEAAHVPDLVPDLIALLELHGDWFDIRYDWVVEGHPLPVRVEPSGFLHAVGIVLLAAAERADRTEDRTVTARCRGSERAVEIVVSVVGDGADGTEGSDGEWRIDVGAAGPLLAAAGGTIETAVEAGGRRVTVSLPSLPELRRREREGAGALAPAPAGEA
jgi:hypothetical protein